MGKYLSGMRRRRLSLISRRIPKPVSSRPSIHTSRSDAPSRCRPFPKSSSHARTCHIRTQTSAWLIVSVWAAVLAARHREFQPLLLLIHKMRGSYRQPGGRVPHCDSSGGDQRARPSAPCNQRPPALWRPSVAVQSHRKVGASCCLGSFRRRIQGDRPLPGHFGARHSDC